MIEISSQPRHISVRRGAIIVSDNETELGQIDLDGVLSMIVTSRGATVTTPMIAEAAARNIPLIICNDRFQPVSVSLPLVQHSDQTRRFEAQALAKKGLKNKIWQKIIKGKVKNQTALLALYQSASVERLNRLHTLIKSGDPQNIEAQAAQVYWPALFGKDFRRDRHRDDVNTLLNYGYAIIRSAMLSAVLSTGLHPTFGIFHKNKNNPLCLVDDLMEPYRPLVDQLVKRLVERGHSTISPTVKRCLASIVTSDQAVVGATSPLFQHMSQLGYALWENLDGQKTAMPMPQLIPELEIEAMVSEC